MDKEFLLAVDGGGAKTQVLVTDLEGNVLARGLGPESNHHRVGFEAFAKALTIAIEGALQHIIGARPRSDQPGWHTARIAAACFGLAGVDGPEDEAQISRWIRQQGIAPTFRVLNDSELILAAGTPEGWGVALIAGTGSVCLGRSPDGRVLRIGGWGHLLGDEGSGYSIAVRALHVATQTADGRANATALLDAVLRHWALADAEALIRHVYTPAMTQSDVAGLAAAVLNLAGRGDAAALGVLNEAGTELALHVETVVRRLNLKHPPLALAGGALRASLRKALQSSITSEMGPIHFVADPSMGAVVLARRLLTTAPRPH